MLNRCSRKKNRYQSYCIRNIHRTTLIYCVEAQMCEIKMRAGRGGRVEANFICEMNKNMNSICLQTCSVYICWQRFSLRSNVFLWSNFFFRFHSLSISFCVFLFLSLSFSLAVSFLLSLSLALPFWTFSYYQLIKIYPDSELLFIHLA